MTGTYTHGQLQNLTLFSGGNNDFCSRYMHLFTHFTTVTLIKAMCNDVLLLCDVISRSLQQFNTFFRDYYTMFKQNGRKRKVKKDENIHHGTVDKSFGTTDQYCRHQLHSLRERLNPYMYQNWVLRQAGRLAGSQTKYWQICKFPTDCTVRIFTV